MKMKQLASKHIHSVGKYVWVKLSSSSGCIVVVVVVVKLTVVGVKASNNCLGCFGLKSGLERMVSMALTPLHKRFCLVGAELS